MATTKIPVWIRSEYVTIVSPPFYKDQGARSAPDLVRGTNRLPFIGSTTKKNTTAFDKIQGQIKVEISKYFCLDVMQSGKHNEVGNPLRFPTFSLLGKEDQFAGDKSEKV